MKAVVRGQTSGDTFISPAHIEAALAALTAQGKLVSPGEPITQAAMGHPVRINAVLQDPINNGQGIRQALLDALEDPRGSIAVSLVDDFPATGRWRR